ncbi:MAG: hypothetical protein AAB787_02680 [Patescibacteria group bacterium]
MKNFKKFLPILILVLGVAFSLTVLAQTGEDEFEIKVSIKVTYPIAELGNCGSKSECKSYCDNPENIESCVAFAKSKGLMNEEEADRANRFSQSLKSGGTPGGCTTPEGCKNFCSDISNIEVCTAWAEKAGIKDEHFNEAKKILNYIKSGGTMPGGCTSEATCKTYCEDFEHADECFAFAEKVGLEMDGGPEGDRPTPAALELIKSGQTPGGCKSKNACETYCQNESHFEECIAFAEKAGFMKPEEVETAKKTGGRGPGGCRGRECEIFCNNPSNQEECFKFAEEHGLMKKEDLERAKEGMVRMKAGLENAPPEVRECLKTKLGTNIIEDIQSGKLTPGSQIGERMRECFESFGASHRPEGVFNNMPSEVAACIKEKGIDVESLKSGGAEFTPEIGDTIRVCFQSSQFGGPGNFGRDDSNGPGSGPSDLSGFLRSAPPEVTSCLEDSLGAEFEKIKSGEMPSDPTLHEKIRNCFDQFHSQNPGPSGSGMGPGSGQNFGPPSGNSGPMGGGLPENVLSCLKGKVSEEQLRLLQRRDRPSPEIERIVGGCFGQMPPRDGASPSGGEFPSPNNFGQNQQGGFPSGGFDPRQILNQFPGAVAECIKANLQESDLMDGTKIRAAAEKCFQTSGGFPPPGSFPEGEFHPEGSFPSPGSFPTDRSMSPPPEGTPPPPPPGGSFYRPSLLGVILGPILDLLR